MLKKYRNEIDVIDKEMKDLFLKRMDVVKHIAIEKAKGNLNVDDINREKEMFNNLLKDINDKKLKELYTAFLFKVIELSKKYQKDVINND